MTSLLFALFIVKPHELRGKRTIVRKYFHAVALFLFLPAMHIDVTLHFTFL
jgi:hypothetical protein